MITKICTKCGIEKPLDEFPKRKESKDGHRADCKVCQRQRSSKYYLDNKDKINDYKKEYKKKNVDKVKTYFKKYRESHKNEIRENNRKYREDNFDKLSSYFKKYIQDNKTVLNEKQREYYKSKDKTSMYYQRKVFRRLIKNSFNSKILKKNIKTEVILGCTYEYFKQYLESKFEYWMSWDNYGLYDGSLNYGWDIDHIIPLYIATTEEELIKLNHYTNLQPLCSKINRDIKRNKLI